MVQKPCPTCRGRRLRPEVLAVTVDGRNISEVSRAVRHRCAGLGGGARRTGSPSASGRSPARCSRRSWRGSGFLVDVGPGLPDPRPGERQPVGRRGAADPAGDPDRHDADGRPVHPRRAVDRPPPAGQRQAHRDAHPAARPGQHASSSSSTTRRRSGRRTGSSTSGPGRGSTAARSSPTARWRRCSRSRARSPAPSCAASARCPIPAQRRRGNGKAPRRSRAPASTT